MFLGASKAYVKQKFGILGGYAAGLMVDAINSTRKSGHQAQEE